MVAAALAPFSSELWRCYAAVPFTLGVFFACTGLALEF
jgi:hypothetical protein